MTVKRLKLRSNADLFADAMEDRQAFDANGTLRGIDYEPGMAPDGFYATGRLDEQWSERYAADHDKIDYVVYSYATPIAWHTENGWTYVTQQFSQTTNRHQYTIRAALRMVGS